MLEDAELEEFRDAMEQAFLLERARSGSKWRRIKSTRIVNA